MKYILHGDDTSDSRNFLNLMLDGNKAEIVDGKSLTESAVFNLCHTDGLFEEKRIIVIENLSKNSKKKEITAFLNSYNGLADIIIWEDKKISKSTFSAATKFEIKEFLLPVYYFEFLDKFVPENKRKEIDLMHLLLKTNAPEQILFSLVKRVRLMIIARNGDSNELRKMPEWMKSKIVRQSKLWNEKKLTDFYQILQNTEINLKTGKLPIDLSKQLDILILSNL